MNHGKHESFQFLEDPIGVNRDFLASVVMPGDLVVDATCGNGHDSFFLRNQIGAQGVLFAYDIQQSAILATEGMINKGGEICRGTTFLLNRSHKDLAEVALYIKSHPGRRLKSVVYNLGYLPGGTREIATQSDITIKSVKNALDLLQNHGVISIMVYAGHDKGNELAAVKCFLSSLNPAIYAVVSLAFTNRQNSPHLFWIEKRLKQVGKIGAQ